MLHGDWGVSLITGTPVSAMLSERAGNTALLAVVTVAIAIPLAAGLGVLMRLGAGRWADRLGNVTVLGLAAAPEFLITTIAVLALAVKFRWLPEIGRASFRDRGSPFGVDLGCARIIKKKPTRATM